MSPTISLIFKLSSIVIMCIFQYLMHWYYNKLLACFPIIYSHENNIIIIIFYIFNFSINCNLDLIISGTDLLKALGQSPGESLDSVSLDNIEDLRNTFTHYFQKGAAAERTFTDEYQYKQIIETAERLPSKQVWTLDLYSTLFLATVKLLWPLDRLCRHGHARTLMQPITRKN